MTKKYPKIGDVVLDFSYDSGNKYLWKVLEVYPSKSMDYRKFKMKLLKRIIIDEKKSLNDRVGDIHYKSYLIGNKFKILTQDEYYLEML